MSVEGDIAVAVVDHDAVAITVVIGPAGDDDATGIGGQNGAAGTVADVDTLVVPAKALGDGTRGGPNELAGGGNRTGIGSENAGDGGATDGRFFLGHDAVWHHERLTDGQAEGFIVGKGVEGIVDDTLSASLVFETVLFGDGVNGVAFFDSVDDAVNGRDFEGLAGFDFGLVGEIVGPQKGGDLEVKLFGDGTDSVAFTNFVIDDFAASIFYDALT